MSKSDYGDLVSVFTTWGSGSTATRFTPPKKTEKTFPFFKRIMESQGKILITRRHGKDEGTEVVLIRTDSAPLLHPKERNMFIGQGRVLGTATQV